ncbi:MAG: hypothetical protein GEU95_17665 [Rhizobiales bacterium]|nr:hypothetical protein [Hyphomicrobiales bacterium]
MAKAENVDITSPSRRAVIAGATALATGAAANVAAIVTASPAEQDPIIGAIERHRRLWIEFGESAVGDDDLSDGAGDAAQEALVNLVSITPTTIPGCVAMLRYCHQVTAVDNHGSAGELFGGYTRVHAVAADLLLRLADRIEAGNGVLLPMPTLVRQQQNDDPVYAVIQQNLDAWANLDAEASALDQAGTPEAEERLSMLQDAVSKAEEGLVNVEPTTLAGVRDLFAYLAECEAKGRGFAGCYVDEEDPALKWKRGDGSFTYFVHKNAAEALDRMTV